MMVKGLAFEVGSEAKAPLASHLSYQPSSMSVGSYVFASSVSDMICSYDGPDGHAFNGLWT